MNRTSTSLLALAMSSVLAFACTESPRLTNADTEPWIKVTANHPKIQAGERDRLATTTQNLVGVREIKWSVLPNASGVHIMPDGDTQNKTAMFEADQPGTYVVRAEANVGNGRVIASDTTIVVDARPGTFSTDH